jgi:hypothetical protein
METPQRKTLTLISPRWEYWVGFDIATDLSILVVEKLLIPNYPYTCMLPHMVAYY